MLIRILRTYLRPYAGLLLLVIGLQLVGTMANLYLPTLNARIIDEGVSRGNIDFIWRTGAIMLAISAVQVICAIIAVYFGAKAAMSFGRDVRGAIFGRVLSFSARELNKFGAPSLITRNTNDVQQVQMLVVISCTILVAAPITMVGGVIMALREDVGLSWLILVSVVILGTVVTIIATRMGPLFRIMQKRIDVVNRVLREQITGVRVVRAFVREPYETERFDRANADLTDTATRARGGSWPRMFPTVMLIMNVSTVAVLWFGSQRIAAGAAAGRAADGLPELSDADPDVGDDGDVPADAGATGGGQRRTDHGRAVHRLLGRPVAEHPVTQLDGVGQRRP